MLDFYSFDFTDPANQGWTGGTFTRVTSSPAPPYGTYSYRGVSTLATATSPSFGNISTSYIGSWVYWSSLASQGACIAMIDGATAQVSVTIETDGSVKVRRGGAGGTVLATSSAGVITAGVWFHLQLSVVYHGSAGSVELRKDGTTVVASASGVNTISTANLYANKIQLIGAPGAAQSFFKGVWISDQGFQGACQTEVLYPIGVGNSSNFTPSGAATGWQATDDPGENDGDSTYAAGVNVGDTDTYAMANMAATTGTIKGVKSNNNWRTDAGARSGARVIRIGSTNYVGATVSANASYTVVGEVLTQSPTTATAWTIAEINGIEHGAKVAA